ncbi:hypothetical protein P3T76_009300 [Phytophthora citrophthora]|uniref:Uncharacterized protein n=1 Tax=Phytophthora citrophthora TaxID=4793 RepID=A0AAD9LIY1_9STRA|nr:hypothetical protein P3T76_009297 [Phytophthora citrophthora]KAK1938150.1 hypothetical protein P3T76_009300 [Phytophthora citrophthora]
MTATNKAFAYVFNTPAEDHNVGRVLSSHAPVRPAHLLSLDTFDVDTQVKIRGVASALFWSSLGLEMPSFNINARVLDTLMAYLLRHYPELKRLNANGPAVQRIEACALEKAITLNELLAWSSHLACNTRTPSTPNITESTHAPAITPDVIEHPMFRHQAALIE